MAALLAAMQQGAAAGAAAGVQAAEGGAAEVDMAAPMDDLLFFADKEGDTTVFGRQVGWWYAASGWMGGLAPGRSALLSLADAAGP